MVRNAAKNPFVSVKGLQFGLKWRPTL